MAGRALTLIPAGAKHLGGTTYQLPARRRSHGAAARGKHHKKKTGRKVGLFHRQWVWYALALSLAEALGDILLPSGVAPWVSVPALILYAYGVWKKKPGAKNAALAIQGAHMLAYWGVPQIVKGVANQLKANPSIPRGPVTGIPFSPLSGAGINLDSRTLGNVIANAQGVGQVFQAAQAFA